LPADCRGTPGKTRAEASSAVKAGMVDMLKYADLRNDAADEFTGKMFLQMRPIVGRMSRLTLVYLFMVR
jgi:hypothetical protein